MVNPKLQYKYAAFMYERIDLFIVIYLLILYRREAVILLWRNQF